MKTFEEVVSEIVKEFEYQDSIFANNDNKPLEVWLIICHQYNDDAIERYAHGTQLEARSKLLKSIACGIRALMSDKAVVAKVK